MRSELAMLVRGCLGRVKNQPIMPSIRAAAKV
jgi:hypothetical protein